MTGNGSGGPAGGGQNWFEGSFEGSDDATRRVERPGGADAAPTEILGARIGRDGTDLGRGRPPMNPRRITWGKPDADATRPAGPDADRTAVLPATGPGIPTGPAGPAGPARAGIPGDPFAPADPFAAASPAGPADPAGATRVFPASGPAGPGTAALRDPWQETPVADGDPGSDAGEHSHDPHEVTVQLDAVAFGDNGVIRRTESNGQRRKGGTEASDRPVFVDESGRRSRLYRRLGIFVGIACAIYAVVIVSTLLSGNSNAPWLPVQGQEKEKPAGEVDSTPGPSQSPEPSVTNGADPRTSSSTGADATTEPGGGASASGKDGASGAAQKPGTSADPAAPVTGGSSQKPGTGTGTGGVTDPGTGTGTQPSTQAPPPVDKPDPSTGGTTGGTTGGGTDPAPPDPTAPTTDPTTDPGTGGDGGTGTLPNGASDTTPIAAGPADGTAVVAVADPGDTSTSPSLSPENTL